MKITRRNMIALALAAGPVAALTPARAAGTRVSVTLWDRGPMSMQMLSGMKGLGFGMHHGEGFRHGPAMMGGQAAKGMMGNGMGPMGIDATPDKVPAGAVTFEVRNDSAGIVHEMIVAPLPKDGAELPFGEAEDEVDEDAAGSLGEVSELDPGESGSLTRTLAPGEYILFCNVPGHYRLGMWTTLTVTG
jgi:uncharacterized cupredoxin-like copper-binding protein